MDEHLGDEVSARRPRGSMARMSTALTVTLREITAETVIPVCRLAVREDQGHLVESNAVSLAQALFNAEAWYRAIYDGDALVEPLPAPLLDVVRSGGWEESFRRRLASRRFS